MGPRCQRWPLGCIVPAQDHRQKIQEVIDDEEFAPALRFFVLYSRFEFALKMAGFVCAGRQDNAVPAWDRFADACQADFFATLDRETRESAAYFEDSPPKTQKLGEDGRVRWVTTPTQRDNLTWLLRMVRAVRNNLFHGSKYPIEPARDEKLLMHAERVLLKCLEHHDAVADCFAFR